MPRRSVTVLGTGVGVALLVGAAALPAWAAQSITVSWVRHAQSTANVAGVIDTTVPGRGLTALGTAAESGITAIVLPGLQYRLPVGGAGKAARMHCSTGGDA
jgi:hypothetical protein